MPQEIGMAYQQVKGRNLLFIGIGKCLNKIQHMLDIVTHSWEDHRAFKVSLHCMLRVSKHQNLIKAFIYGFEK